MEKEGEDKKEDKEDEEDEEDEEDKEDREGQGRRAEWSHGGQPDRRQMRLAQRAYRRRKDSIPQLPVRRPCPGWRRRWSR